MSKSLQRTKLISITTALLAITLNGIESCAANTHPQNSKSQTTNTSADKLAQNQTDDSQDNDDSSKTGVALTYYQLLTGKNGQEFYLNQSGQAIPLPGDGVAPNSGDLAIYTGNYGESWYVDQNGKQVDMPPLTIPPTNAPGYQAAPGYAPNPDYYGQNYGQGPYANYSGGAYNYGYQPAPNNPNIQNSGQPPQVNVYNSPSSQSNSGSGSGSSGSSAVSAGMGAAVGAMAGSAMMLAFDTIPYGCPVYYGGGHPYYWGANGSRVFVNNKEFNNNVVNSQWKDQHNWYNHQVNDQNGRYHGNNWPGKEHGFPQHQAPGRLYSQGAMGRDTNFGNNRFGGGHFGEGFGRHFGSGMHFHGGRR